MSEKVVLIFVSLILVVQVVGVLPYVHREDGLKALHEGVLRSESFHYFQLACILVILDQPYPAAAESR